ncbi:MAG: heme exporter protein CcmB [Chloroflexia bacterium]|nr:heme exporter protein CcmB [Chloroflexia bacterium]
MRPFVAQVGAVLRKDVLIEFRRRELVVSTFVFAMLLLVVFNFAFDLHVENLYTVGPGALWVAIFFAGVLNIGRTFLLERERGGWEGLLLAPLEPGVLYVAKVTGNILFMLVVEALLLPAFAALYNLPVLDPVVLWVMLLGTVGFAAVGTLFSAISANSRAREVLLPVLLFPILVPLLIATVRATTERVAPAPAMGSAPWASLLFAFDVLVVLGGYLLFDHVIEE